MWACVNFGLCELWCYLCTALKSCSCRLYDSCQYPTYSLCEIRVQIKVALVATNCRHYFSHPSKMCVTINEMQK